MGDVEADATFFFLRRCCCVHVQAADTTAVGLAPAWPPAPGAELTQHAADRTTCGVVAVARWHDRRAVQLAACCQTGLAC